MSELPAIVQVIVVVGIIVIVWCIIGLLILAATEPEGEEYMYDHPGDDDES